MNGLWSLSVVLVGLFGVAYCLISAFGGDE